MNYDAKIVIERGVEMPLGVGCGFRHGYASMARAALAAMNVGDSFVVEGKSRLISLRSTATREKWPYASKKIGPDTWRVWKIEKKAMEDRAEGRP